MLGASTSFEFCGTRNTYFVPTDYAFRKLDPADLQRVFSSPNYLRNILSNHRADRIVPSTLIRERWQYEIQTNSAAIVRVVNSGDKLTVYVHPYYVQGTRVAGGEGRVLSSFELIAVI